MCQTQSDQINEIAKALAAAQAELEPAAKNAENPHLRNRYADLSGGTTKPSARFFQSTGWPWRKSCCPATTARPTCAPPSCTSPGQ